MSNTFIIIISYLNMNILTNVINYLYLVITYVQLIMIIFTYWDLLKIILINIRKMVNFKLWTLFYLLNYYKRNLSNIN